MEELIEKYSEESEEREIVTELEADDSCMSVTADRFWIKDALTNLYDNAIKYSPDGGTIKVRVTKKELTICNTMANPDIDDPEKLKERFVRGEQSRGGQKGNGLGLSIADSILSRNGLKLILKKENQNFIATIK